MTAFQDVVLRSIIQSDVPEQIGFGEVSREVWGECALTMKERLREFFELAALGINIVVNGQERDFNEEETTDILMPAVSFRVTPSVVDWLNPELDYIGHTFIKEETVKVVRMKGKQRVVLQKKMNKHCLRIGPNAMYVTKFRIPGTELPDYIVDPHYSKLATLID